MKEVKLSFSVDEITANQIEKYWHARRFPNKTEALRHLIKKGLENTKYESYDDTPTQKQINLVNQLCKEKKLSPPKEWNIRAYAEFISKNVKKKKEQ